MADLGRQPINNFIDAKLSEGWSSLRPGDGQLRDFHEAPD